MFPVKMQLDYPQDKLDIKQLPTVVVWAQILS